MNEVGVSESLIKDIFRPMTEFLENGFLYVLNRDYMIPRGMYLGLYIDDEDGSTALGWICIPYEEAVESGIIPRMDDVAQREEAFNCFTC